MALRPLFHSCSQSQLVSGKQTSFWFDGWAGQPFSSTKPARPLPQKRISVHDARSCHHMLLPQPITSQQHDAIRKLMSFTPAQGTDSLTWTVSPSGNFTAASTYRIISQGGKVLSPFTAIWKARVTPSMRIFFFFLLNNRILTHDVMDRRNIPHTPGCVMCANGSPETSAHLVLRCPFAASVWATLSRSVRYPLLVEKETILQTYLASIPLDKRRRGEWHVRFIVASWFIWRERNDRTFRQNGALPSVVASRIEIEARLCQHYC